MSEHSVQVVISEPDGRQVRVHWQGAAPEGPLVLQVSPLRTPVPARHAFFPAACEELNTPSVAPVISLELRWAEPPPPPQVELAKPPSEPAPLATAWAVERLRQRHLASVEKPARPRVQRTAER